MKKTWFLMLILLGSIPAWQASAQVSASYEKGYVVDKNGRKLQVQILNEDWSQTPAKIKYKYKNGTREATPTNVKAIGIPGKWKYISATVDMDTVPDITDRLSKNRNPQWVRKTVFLKVLVDGKADLFMYKQPNLVKFFYRIDQQPIQPLTYRRYYMYDEKGKNYNRIGVNNDYQQTLYNKLKCPRFRRDRFATLPYNSDALKRIFMEYNQCKKQNYKQYHTYNSPGIFQIYGFIRGDLFQLQILNSQTQPVNQPDAYHTGGGLGVSLEYVLPFRHNIWGIYSDPGLRWAQMELSFEKKNAISGSVEKYKWEYTNLSFDFPVGIRIHFLRRENWNMYAEMGYVMNIRLGSQLKQYKDDEWQKTIQPQSKAFWQWGIGMTAGRINATLRYYTNRNLIANYTLYDSPYRGYALMLAYKIWEHERFR